MKITHGFDIDKDGVNDVYITREPLNTKTGCLGMVAIGLFCVLLMLWARHRNISEDYKKIGEMRSAILRGDFDYVNFNWGDIQAEAFRGRHHAADEAIRALSKIRELKHSEPQWHISDPKTLQRAEMASKAKLTAIFDEACSIGGIPRNLWIESGN